MTGLCGRSWAALRASLGGPGPSWAEKRPWPKREGDLGKGSMPKSGPNPSGNAIWAGDQGRKEVLPPEGAEPAAEALDQNCHRLGVYTSTVVFYVFICFCLLSTARIWLSIGLSCCFMCVSKCIICSYRLVFFSPRLLMFLHLFL